MKAKKLPLSFFIFVCMVSDDFSLKLIKWYKLNKRNIYHGENLKTLIKYGLAK